MHPIRRRSTIAAAAVAAAASVLAAPARLTAQDAALAGVERELDVPLETARRYAADAGPLELAGRVHLEGAVYADGLHVLPGAEVTMARGTTIFCSGDFVLDAPLVGLATSGPGKVGANGADRQGYAVVCDQGGNVVINQPVLLEDGGAGEDVIVVDDDAIGGDGGAGGGITVRCPGKVTISANVVPGRGGRGGFARSTGSDGAAGAPGQPGFAQGGDGGISGDVVIVCDTIEFTLDVNGKAEGKIGLRPGGEGGDAEAFGGAGGAANDCGMAGGAGGSARAVGGGAGPGTNALVEARQVIPAGFDVRDFVRFDESERPDGGAATATAGKGGAGATCDPSDPCPAVGTPGSAGGAGGRADATGGAGASGARVGPGKGVLVSAAQSGGETPPGDGGRATATAGDGAPGGNGNDGQAPGAGGRGGAGAKAKATGGAGGSSILGRKFNQPLGDGQGPLTGGRGGDATAVPGDGAGGGSGGDCCNHPRGKGAKGGAGGAAGSAAATGGKGGKGFARGPDGAATPAAVGTKGSKGANGVDCPTPVTETLTARATLASRLFVGVDSPLGLSFANSATTSVEFKIIVCCDGRPIGAFDFSVPGASIAGPGVASTVFNLHIDSVHASHRISVKIFGKTVKTFAVPVVPK